MLAKPGRMVLREEMFRVQPTSTRIPRVAAVMPAAVENLRSVEAKLDFLVTIAENLSKEDLPLCKDQTELFIVS
jgi:hypothetical protein